MFKKNNPYVWIIGLGIIVYIWTVFFGFTYFDDKTLILDNLFFLKNLGNLPLAFTTEVFHILHSSAAYYRPLLTISFMLDAQISGSNPFFYHLVNVAIHILASYLVFTFLQKIEIKKEIALLLSLIFAVHPVLSQAVAWIPGRNDSLLAVFALLSFIFFLNYLKSDKPKDIFWHAIFFVCAIFTKESGLIIVPLIIFYVLLFKNWKYLVDKLHLFLIWGTIGGVWYLLRSYALQNPIHYSLIEVVKSLYTSLPVILLDIGKVIIPINLSVLPTIQDSTLIWGVLATLLILGFLIFSKNKNNKLLIFGVVWFLVFLLPSFVRPSTDYVPDFLEHRMYLPIIGIFLVFSQFEFLKNFSFSNKNSKILFGSIISLLIVVNFIHTSLFRNRLVFWQSAVKTSPHHPLAHKNLGAMYYLDKNLDKAEEEYKQSLQLNPKEPMIHSNLGLIYADRGENDKAEEEYKKELELNPSYDNALYNYGLLLYREGKKEGAETFWLKTLNVNPDYVDAMRNLFIVYYESKDADKANYFYNELRKRGINQLSN